MNPELTGSASNHQVLENAVHDFLVEAPRIPKRGEIELKGFGLDAQLVGHVVDCDTCEIRLSRNWAEGCEVGALKSNPVVSLRICVLESLNRSRGWRSRD